jgi:hypothetical protein
MPGGHRELLLLCCGVGQTAAASPAVLPLSSTAGRLLRPTSIAHCQVPHLWTVSRDAALVTCMLASTACKHMCGMDAAVQHVLSEAQGGGALEYGGTWERRQQAVHGQRGMGIAGRQAGAGLIPGSRGRRLALLGRC